jgi:hypothetical protein
MSCPAASLHTMADKAFQGARVEIRDEILIGPGPDADDEWTYRSVTVSGRAAGGTWLTVNDARCSLSREHVQVEADDGGLYVTNANEIIARVQQAFPNADVWYCPDGNGSELEPGPDGAPEIFAVEIPIGPQAPPC